MAFDKPRPTARQLEYQDWEFGIFLHFGIRTFYEGWKDFDERRMMPEKFLPSNLNCDQWAEAAKTAGARYMVLTAKHHDGFANWPSKYTKFSVASSTWQNGTGDVVREFVDACRKRGLAVGLYYSPVDIDCPAYADEKAYDDYFINQISELLSGYGPIDILWFDGCGSANHHYDWDRIVGEIRRLQPRVLLFNMGDPDFRWVGNEEGLAPIPCWNVVDRVPFAVDTFLIEKMRDERPRWLPAESDCRMRRQNWFYSDQDEETVKSVPELMGLYDYSIGRGTNLLLNIGPDRRGLLPEKDTQRLLEFGAAISNRFAHPLATLENCRQEGNRQWRYRPEVPQLFQMAVVQENIASGESIRRFAIKILTTQHGVEITVFEGYNIGHKAICNFPPVMAREIFLEILESDEQPQIRSLNFHGV